MRPLPLSERERRKLRRLARRSLRLAIAEGISPASDAALQEFDDYARPIDWTVLRLLEDRPAKRAR